jgi:predicted nucleic acid-binding protein
MNYLLDTCVLSELIKKDPNRKFLTWVSTRPKNALFISAITVAEIWQGIRSLPAGTQRDQLTKWFSGLKSEFSSHVVPIDFEVAIEYGDLQGSAKLRGKPFPVLDCLIAATALCHRMVVITRNVKDFDRTGAEVFNPWE